MKIRIVQGFTAKHGSNIAGYLGMHEMKVGPQQTERQELSKPNVLEILETPWQQGDETSQS